MCGIAGILKYPHNHPTPAWPPPAAAALDRMSQSLALRGPDGHGLWTDPRPGRTVALIHRRLAILDLPAGAQPMTNEDRSVWVVFNGEIYNHAELRRELTAQGHTFASHHSDTEVLLHGWEEWRENLPAKLLGMFAFAIWDMTADTLFLARDRMGQKPLFYASLEDGLVFGSTIPSVLAWPEVPRRAPREQLGLYLQLGYIPPPSTIYRDISQLLPGHWIRVQRDVLSGERYWQPRFFFRDPHTRYRPRPQAEVQAELRALIDNAVRSQLLADVPVACFLSGGIDSSIVAALMQQAVRQLGGDAITTVSVGFQEAAFDESDYAQTVASQIGSKHVRLTVDPSRDIPATLHALITQTLGQPFADSSLLPTHHLSQAVRSLATVALSGDGSDELFAGYDRYQAINMLPQYRALLRLLPDRLPAGRPKLRERWRRMVHAARTPSLSQAYTRLLELFPHADAQRLLHADFEDWAPLPSELDAPDWVSPLRLAMLRDQREYLPGDVLWKVDSAAMAVALEVRSPFLDHRVVEAANLLWETQLIGNRVGKLILRETFADLLPPNIRTRSKQGFGVPIGAWFRQELQPYLRDTLLARNSFAQSHLNLPAVERLLHEHQLESRDHTHRLFALLMLEEWWRTANATIE